ncbi:STP1 protein [Plasmodium ovale wallikeri]|uniref:STP1 protein n=1 Tax=Plasmodium ovale wallikeri TaxID=864142 RepID=A0A1A9AR67_PLAOA|nr:STP1 protein [Plasmodium ovale wallikeri]
MEYSVTKMVDNLGYTTHLRNIPIEVFLDMIEGDIKKLIHTYGHRNCGLRYEELCDKIKTIIVQKKPQILKHMDNTGKATFNREWDSKRNGFINKLFEEEGFINMCFPKKYTNNPNLDQLLSKHIKFCKEKDVRRLALEKNNEYSVCTQYNSWIDTQRKLFTHEYLKNVSDFTSKTVHKYFSTKEQPRGHDPLVTYFNSKLNCAKYNSPPNKDSKRPTAKEPSNSINPPTAPAVTQSSKETKGKSIPDIDSGSSKTEPDENMPHKPKTSTAGSTIHSSIKIEPDDPVNGEQSNVNAKSPVPPIKGDGEKKETTSIQSEPSTNVPPTKQDEASPQTGSPPPPLNDARLTPAIQIEPVPTATTSPSSTLATVQNTISSKTPVTSSILTVIPVSSPNSDSPSTSNLSTPAAEAKGQNKASQSSTTSETLPTTHPIQSVPSTAPADLSLPPLQAPVLNASPIVNTAKDPGTSASTSASAITTTFTTSTATPRTVTIPTMSTTKAPMLSTQAPSTSSSQEAPPPQVASGPKATESITGPQQTVIHQTTSIGGREKGGNSVPTQTNGNKIITLSENTPQQSKDSSLVSSTSLPEGAQPNGKPSITSTKIPPLTTIIPTIIIILAAITLLFQFYKYTPFGFLLGRKRKRKKQDLKRIFEIPEKPTYESPNITVHEFEDPNLVGQTVENDVYTKLLKINRYKQEMQKRKKKNKKTLIEVHMEVFDEYKNDEWELHKGDFLEICLRGFINEGNETYQKFPNSKLTINNIKNEKTIEDVQKQEILWNNWIENHRNILELWKKEKWFHVLKNKWRNEEQKYKEKNDKLQENILNEQETYSIVNQKDIWKQWISKQATLIDMFNKEDWFKSVVYAQNTEKDNYNINEYNNTSITSKTELKNEKTNYEHCRRKNIIQKLMVQIHMMVLEESIKEDIIKHKELCIDNFIEDTYNQNNYDEKRNIPQRDTDDFSVP